MINITDQELYDVKKLVGLPYKHLGRNYLEGLDCMGFLIHAYNICGYKVLDCCPQYEEDFSKTGKNYILNNIVEQWTQTDYPEIGDLCLMGLPLPHHLGISIGNDRIIHCMRGFGVLITPVRILKQVYGWYSFTDQFQIETKLWTDHILSQQ